MRVMVTSSRSTISPSTASHARRLTPFENVLNQVEAVYSVGEEYGSDEDIDDAE